MTVIMAHRFFYDDYWNELLARVPAPSDLNVRVLEDPIPVGLDLPDGVEHADVNPSDALTPPQRAAFGVLSDALAGWVESALNYLAAELPFGDPAWDLAPAPLPPDADLPARLAAVRGDVVLNRVTLTAFEQDGVADVQVDFFSDVGEAANDDHGFGVHIRGGHPVAWMAARPAGY